MGFGRPIGKRYTIQSMFCKRSSEISRKQYNPEAYEPKKKMNWEHINEVMYRVLHFARTYFFFCSLFKNVSTKFSRGVQDCIDCIANVS